MTTLAISKSIGPLNFSVPIYDSVFQNWHTIMQALQYGDETTYKLLQTDLAAAANAIFNQVGPNPTPNEDPLAPALRGNTLFWAVLYDNPQLIQYALQLYNNITVTPNLEKAVYWAAVRYNSTYTYLYFYIIFIVH